VRQYIPYLYDLSIYDSEKKATHSFTGVKLENVKFLGVSVIFDGNDHMTTADGKDNRNLCGWSVGGA